MRPRRKYLFFVPLVILTTIIVYGYYASNLPGTLVVGARDASSQKDLSVSASVNGMPVTTPSTLALPQGVYTVTFSQLNGIRLPVRGRSRFQLAKRRTPRLSTFPILRSSRYPARGLTSQALL